jgi:predicted pyridoxine 5'-phosphate oxidase superfamily flavin-nucleotide-binding protein
MGYHEGEDAVQRRAGLTREDWGSAGVSALIPPVAGEFLRRQRMLFFGVADSHQAVWAGLVTGPAGFAETVGDRIVIVNSLPARQDPLGVLLNGDHDVGMLAIEPQTRRRLRVNGRARRQAGCLVVSTEQVYSNCPKYIQVRDIVADNDDASVAAAPALITGALTSAQRRRVAEADTFFIATHTPRHGADVSHRGGNPGFVGVVGPRRLRWPDYVGNSMYMTLGNLELTSGAGLLFVDWEQGHTLQLTGHARVDWEPDHAAAVPGALRLIEFDIDQVVELRHASPLRWRLYVEARDRDRKVRR